MISYILKALASYLHLYIFSTYSFPWNIKVLILSFTALVLSLLFVWVTEQKFVNDLSLIINHKSLHDDIWNDTIDYKNGTTLRIVCQDSIYTGVLVGHEEKGLDSWFILEDYTVEENDTVRNSENITYHSRLAINLKNVKRIELFYGDVEEINIKHFYDYIRNKIKIGFKR